MAFFVEHPSIPISRGLRSIASQPETWTLRASVRYGPLRSATPKQRALPGAEAGTRTQLKAVSGLRHQPATDGIGEAAAAERPGAQRRFAPAQRPLHPGAGAVATGRSAHTERGLEMQFITPEDKWGLMEVTLFQGTCALVASLSLGLTWSPTWSMSSSACSPSLPTISRWLRPGRALSGLESDAGRVIIFRAVDSGRTGESAETSHPVRYQCPAWLFYLPTSTIHSCPFCF